jgi:hypothetical protein
MSTAALIISITAAVISAASVLMSRHCASQAAALRREAEAIRARRAMEAASRRDAAGAVVQGALRAEADRARRNRYQVR